MVVWGPEPRLTLAAGEVTVTVIVSVAVLRCVSMTGFSEPKLITYEIGVVVPV